MGRMYSLTTAATASTQIDLFEVVPADDRPVVIHGLYITQAGEVGDVEEEFLLIKIIRGHTAGGSGGSSITPARLNINDTTSGFTASGNNTTVASSGSYETLHQEAFNVRAGMQYIPTPETRIVTTQGQSRFVVRLATTPADSIMLYATLLVEEI